MLALTLLNFSNSKEQRLYFTFILYTSVYLNVVGGSALSDTVLVETVSVSGFGR